MTVNAFFDTNILLYALGAPAGSSTDARNEAAYRLVDAGGRISVQILNEFTDVAVRKLQLSWPTIQELLALTEVLCGKALPLTSEAQKSAVSIASRLGYRIYDAMIVASALEAGCTKLYTEDLHHGQVVEGLRIENPFRGLATP